MPQRALRRVSPRLCAGTFAALLAVGAAGCGGDKLDISKAVESANSQLQAVDVKLACPDTVDKDAVDIDCTVQAAKTGKTAPVKFTVAGEQKDTLTAKDQTAYQQALEEVLK